jgi:hypothetical protein
MTKDRSYGSEYQKELLKIGWEAVRRSKEYRDDFQKIDQACSRAGIGELSLIDSLPPEIQKMWRAFREKWGCDPLPPGLSFDKIKKRLDRLYAQKKKAAPKMQKGLKHRKAYEDTWQIGRPHGFSIPLEFGRMYNRLQGYNLKQQKPVRCLEAERDVKSIQKFMGPGPYEKPPDKRRLSRYLLNQKDWPPREINFTIDLDAASEEEILDRVKKEVRYYQEVRKRVGLSLARPRYHLDIYRDCFKVYDMFKSGMTADQIAPLMWPKEYEEVGGRDDIGWKSRLIQRAYDYRDRATEIIEQMVDKVRESTIQI